MDSHSHALKSKTMIVLHGKNQLFSQILNMNQFEKKLMENGANQKPESR